MTQHELNLTILEILGSLAKEVDRLYSGEIIAYDTTAIRHKIEQLIHYNLPVNS